MNPSSRGREVLPFASRPSGCVLVLSGGAERKESRPPNDKPTSPPEKDVAPVVPADPIDEAEIDSFPASDPPSHTPVHGTGPAPGS